MAPIAVLPEQGANQLESLTTSFDDTIRFYLNGTRVVLDEVDPEVTLLEYLRGIGLTGTKLYVPPKICMKDTPPHFIYIST